MCSAGRAISMYDYSTEFLTCQMNAPRRSRFGRNWTAKYKLKTVMTRQLQATKGSFFSAAVPRKYRTQVNGKTVETNAKYVVTVTFAATGQKISRTYTIMGKLPKGRKKQ